MVLARKGHKMTRLLELLPTRIVRSEEGTTSIEYALIASLIFLAIVVAVTGLGAKITGMYQIIVNRLP
jgi:pilus assembly protein Flp/PilA